MVLIIINPMLFKAINETVGINMLWGAGAVLFVLIAVVAVVGTKMEKKRGGKQDDTLKLG